MNTLSVRDFRKYILVFLLFEIGIGWVMESPTYNHIILMMLIYSIGYYLGHSNDEWIQRITVKKCILVWLLPTAVLFSSQYFHLGRPFSNPELHQPLHFAASRDDITHLHEMEDALSQRHQLFGKERTDGVSRYL